MNYRLLILSLFLTLTIPSRAEEFRSTGMGLGHLHSPSSGQNQTELWLSMYRMECSAAWEKHAIHQDQDQTTLGRQTFKAGYLISPFFSAGLVTSTSNHIRQDRIHRDDRTAGLYIKLSWPLTTGLMDIRPFFSYSYETDNIFSAGLGLMIYM